ncbi:MATE family efflux transporter [Streptosporangium canum]|uniref:MATE family efflux transporter n=1 Tax=Streptosporangium canum TaxID=324952 RepID=UPI00378AB80C
MGLASSTAFGLIILTTNRWIAGVFTDDPEVRSRLIAILIIVAVLQPVAGIVFVLDGVLVGAGDARYLAAAGLMRLAAFLPAAWLVHAAGGGVTSLRLARQGLDGRPAHEPSGCVPVAVPGSSPAPYAHSRTGLTSWGRRDGVAGLERLR